MEKTFIKKANTECEFSPDQILELKKCASDPIYFISNYCKIQHPVRGSIPFKLYDYQKNMLKSFQHNRMTIVLSARQTGKCVSGETKINIMKPPTGLKRLIYNVIR